MEEMLKNDEERSHLGRKDGERENFGFHDDV